MLFCPSNHFSFVFFFLFFTLFFNCLLFLSSQGPNLTVTGGDFWNCLKNEIYNWIWKSSGSASRFLPVTECSSAKCCVSVNKWIKEFGWNLLSLENVMRWLLLWIKIKIDWWRKDSQCNDVWEIKRVWEELQLLLTKTNRDWFSVWIKNY